MKVTVRTLDSRNEDFDLGDEVTVKELKDLIADKMAIPLTKQRLIFQGKVLKDDKKLKDYGVSDGRVVHLVDSPPPSSTGQTAATQSSSGPSSRPPGEGGVRAQQDLLFVSAMPMPPGGSIAQMTQSIVDNIMGSLSQAGQAASVSAHARTVDSTGRTQESVHRSVTTTGVLHFPHFLASPRSSPSTTPSQTGTVTSAPPPTSRPADTTQPPSGATPPTSQPSAVPTSTSDQDPLMSQERARMRQRAEERRRMVEQRMRDKNRRQIKDVYRHLRSAQRCLVLAGKVFQRYEKACARRVKLLAEREQERRRRAGDEEAMEVSSTSQEAGPEGAEAMDTSAGATGEGVAQKPKEEELKVDEWDGQDLTPVPYSKYEELLRHLLALQARIQPLAEQHQRQLAENRTYDSDDGLVAERVAITVRDVYYYLGHAQVSMSRLHVAMNSAAPRKLKVMPPRRTEMRQVFRTIHAMGPSGSDFVVDFEGEGRDGGRATSSQATPTVASGSGRVRPGTSSSEGQPRAGAEGRSRASEETKTTSAGADVTATTGEVKSSPPTEPKLPEAPGGAEPKAPEATADAEPKVPSSQGGAEPKAPEGEGGTSASSEETREGRHSDDPVERAAAMGIPLGLPFLAPPIAGPSGFGIGPITVAATFDAQSGEVIMGEAGEGVARTIAVDVTGEPGSTEQKVTIKDSSTGQTETKTMQGARPQATGEAGKGQEGASGEDKPKETSDGAKISDPMVQKLSLVVSHMVDNLNHEIAGEPYGDDVVEGGADSGGERRPRPFIERYTGPPGSTVTIRSTPQPAFGIPGLAPVSGPSLSIYNPGEGQEARLDINFPTPPALSLLQHILQTNEEDEEGEEGEGEGETGGTAKEGEAEGSGPQGDQPPGEGGRPARRKRRAGPEELFTAEEDVDSISDAGSLDSIDSDHEIPPEVEHPMSRIVSSAMEDMLTGERHTMQETMQDLKEDLHITETPCNEDLGVVDNLLEMISKTLTILEVMSVFRGAIEPIERLQPCLLNFIQDKCLGGEEPTPERRERAVEAFLDGCVAGVQARQDKLPLRDPQIDFPQTLYNTLRRILRGGYDIIVTRHSGGNGFAQAIHDWGTRSAGLFASILRHCTHSDEHFETVVKELLVAMFPSPSPDMIVSMCSDTVLSEMKRLRDSGTFSPEEIEENIVYVQQPTSDGATPSTSTAGPSAAAEEWPEGMPKEWISTIKRDRQTQEKERGRNQPLSDAYLVGVPAKKRKLNSGEPEARSTEEMLAQVVGSAIATAGVNSSDGATVKDVVAEASRDEELKQKLAVEMYEGVRERLEGDPDYDKERFSNTEKYYRPSTRQ